MCSELISSTFTPTRRSLAWPKNLDGVHISQEEVAKFVRQRERLITDGFDPIDQDHPCVVVHCTKAARPLRKRLGGDQGCERFFDQRSEVSNGG